MRISTLTNWAYGFTVLLTGVSGGAFLMASDAARQERAAVEQHLAFDLVAEDLAMGVERMTDEARLYAMRGTPRHLSAYRHEADVVQTRDRSLAKVRTMGASAQELAAVAEAERNLGELDRIEQGALTAIQAGDVTAARQTLFGPEHERIEASVVSALDHFRVLTAARTSAEMKAARQASDARSLLAKITLALTALLFLGVLYFILKRRVAVPLVRMTGIVKRLARQDYEVEVPHDRRRDEIGEMSNAIAIFRQNGLERERLEAERQADQRTKDCMLQMLQRLQACETRQELGEVVACFAPQAFPDLAGRIFVIDNPHELSQIGSWQSPVGSADSFPPSACWGLRRGRPHVCNDGTADVTCLHVQADKVQGRTMCVPLVAQGETIGMLYFEERPDLPAPQESQRAFLGLLSDNVALALANLRLRERLASLAVRDALTGLNNRRSLDDALNTAAERHEPLACLMLDIDHFKRFNDNFGHDAGDAVMQHVAEMMTETVGDRGACYRFGGEEFTILMSGLDEAAAAQCADALRVRVGEAKLAHHGRMLGQITVSLGVAVAPCDGPASTLLRRADAALLEAKAAGRNRVVTASGLSAPVRMPRSA